MTDMTPVHDFLDASGVAVGCGTKLELDYWTAEGVLVGVSLGRIITHEPAAMDEKRKAAWAK